MIPWYLMMKYLGVGKPRASGDDPGPAPTPPIPTRVNPARAGMIRGFTVTWPSGGSKPRASGDDPARHKYEARKVGVNPARAGMILPAAGSAGRWWRKPRASGDDPARVIHLYRAWA